MTNAVEPPDTELLYREALQLGALRCADMRLERLARLARELLPADAVALGRRRKEHVEFVAHGGLSEEERIPRVPWRELKRDGALRVLSPTETHPFDGHVVGRDRRVVKELACPDFRAGKTDCSLVVVTTRADGFGPSVVRRFEALAQLVRVAMGSAVSTAANDDRDEVDRKSCRSFRRNDLRLAGNSPVLRELRKEISLAARSSVPVLVWGETGAGKELVARRIHGRSERRERPLVVVNCGALTPTLSDSELFGHVRGAFTGADQARVGYFEQADGGTIFLDEVGELPTALQAKVLRAIQFGELQRVGSDTPVRVDVRIIAATNRDLAREAAAGRFRADLYYRLNGYPVRVPSLRDRREDLMPLTEDLVQCAACRAGSGEVRIDPAVLELLAAHDWPGNVRELQHVIERAVVRLQGEVQEGGLAVLKPTHLDLVPRRQETGFELPGEEVGFSDAVASYQRAMITSALQKFDLNYSQAARFLRIDSSNLHRLARRLGIKA